ncbi:MAG: hypothetical protein ACE5FJ_08235 [Gemmatimonadales bacterium]
MIAHLHSVLMALMGVLIWYCEARRRSVDGKENALVYGASDHRIHDIQRHEGRLGYVEAGAGLTAALLAVATTWAAIIAALACGALLAYSAALYGNYAFQVWINRAYRLADIDPDERPFWYSPHLRRMVPKLWYGRRRRYQRLVAVALGFVTLAFYVALTMLTDPSAYHHAR